jgi:2-amino-4-hydroxy-6-hydroxymethyldihydropteridine diphosphokinase
MDRVAIAIGSNVGDRAAHIQFAHERLADLLADLRISSLFETDPVGVSEPQSKFLNAAVVGEASGLPRELLQELLSIEHSRGRTRPFQGAPRTLDLDLILFGCEVIDEAEIQVPHPRFRDRLFVLEPLAQIAPDLRDPVSGKTVRELLADLRTPKPTVAAVRP